MKPTLAASLLAPGLLWAVAAPAAAQSSSPGDFRLPPNPTPTADPDIQGPVDPDQPFRTRPRAPTPTPTPRATPTPAPTTVTLPTPEPSATRQPAPRPTAAAARQAPARSVPTPEPTPLATATAEASPFPLPTTASLPPAVAATPAEDEGGFPWSWTLLGVLALAAGGAGFALFRRRQEEWAEPPAIEPPLARRAAPAPEPADAPAVALAPVAPLMVEAQALTLSRSMMFATLKYELRLANRGKTPLTDIRLGGDLVTAHGRVPVDQQLADPAAALEVIQRVPSLEPGQSSVLTGELRLPVQQIRPIRQGSAVLYIPLLRLRIEAAELAPFARTFVVGKRPAAPGGRLQPFRLDETPQTYRGIAQRALD